MTSRRAAGCSCLALALVAACRGGGDAEERRFAARAADAVAYTVMAHRYNYAQLVVERLGQAGVVTADEDYDGPHKALPLPAQFLRLAGERLTQSAAGEYVSFSLISDFAISRVNRPRSHFERQGLEELRRAPDEIHRGVQEVGGRRYLSSMYADRAVTPACVSCHNEHPDSPRHDFRLGDVMGALIVSLALDP